MLFSLLSISYGGIGYRFFTDPRLKNLSLSAIVLGSIGVLNFPIAIETGYKISNGLLWVVEIINLFIWAVLIIYLTEFKEMDQQQRDKLMTYALLGSFGVTALVVSLVQFRLKRKDSIELDKVRKVYERLTMNQE